MLVNKNFIVALNIIKIGYINRKPQVKVYNTRMTFGICWHLLNLGYFDKIEFERVSNKLVIWLRYFRGRAVFQNIQILYSARRPKVVTFWQLKRYYKNKVMLVSTSRGIVMRSDCLKYRIGGTLIASLN